MKDLFVKRNIVGFLGLLNRKDEFPTREKLLEDVIKLPHRLYSFDTPEEYRKRINDILGDCIAPNPSVPREQRNRYYIDDIGDRERYKVTKAGRKLVDPWWVGFIGEIYREHPIAWIVVSFVLGYVLQIIIAK